MESKSFFNQNLKWIRRYHHLSQEQLAEKLNLKRNNIASYELGNSSPNILRAIEIARFFNLPLEVMVLTDFKENAPKLKKKSLIEERLEDIIKRQEADLNSWKTHLKMLDNLVKGYESMFEFDTEGSVAFSFTESDTKRIIRLLNKDKHVIDQMLKYIEDN